MNIKNLAITFGLVTLSHFVFAQQTTAPLPITKNDFLVIAHGNAAGAPANTLVAITEAAKLGADYAAIDIKTTRDGKIVLSDGTNKINELNFEDLSKIGVLKGKTKYAIPTLAEALQAAKNKINLYIDFQDSNFENVYKQIKEAGMEKNVVLHLNKVDHFLAWRKLATNIPLIATLPSSVKVKEDIGLILERIQLEGIDNAADTSFLNYLNQNGVHSLLNVVGDNDKESTWKTVIKTGIQGLQTNHPSELIKYLNANKLRTGKWVKPIVYPIKEAPKYNKLSNIRYSFTYPENVMDVYIPIKYDSAKVILYIHGGGWTGGDKGEFPKQLLDELVGKRHYIVASMNYRLIVDGKNRFPAQMEDVSSAMTFLTYAAKKYNFSATNFALMGGSAGGYMAMLYAYGYDKNKQVKTVIDYWGPTDLADKSARIPGSDTDRTATNLVGEANPEAKINFDASPYYRITKESAVPTILFHGGDDPLVPVSQADKMYKKLSELNVPTQFYMYPGEKHGVGGALRRDLFTKTLMWIEKYFPAK